MDADAVSAAQRNHAGDRFVFRTAGARIEKIAVESRIAGDSSKQGGPLGVNEQGRA